MSKVIVVECGQGYWVSTLERVLPEGLELQVMSVDELAMQMPEADEAAGILFLSTMHSDLWAVRQLVVDQRPTWKRAVLTAGLARKAPEGFEVFHKTGDLELEWSKMVEYFTA